MNEVNRRVLAELAETMSNPIWVAFMIGLALGFFIGFGAAR